MSDDDEVLNRRAADLEATGKARYGEKHWGLAWAEARVRLGRSKSSRSRQGRPGAARFRGAFVQRGERSPYPRSLGWKSRQREPIRRHEARRARGSLC